MSSNYYDILGVDKKCSKDDIKKKYRSLAMKYHPDKNPGDKSAEDQFKKITEAYEVLSDENRRKQYDMFGTDRLKNSRRSDPRDFYSHFQDDNGFHDLDDLFEELKNRSGGFGGNRNRNRRSRVTAEKDIEMVCKISLQNALKGGKIPMQYDRVIICKDCQGFGGSTEGACSHCNGRGSISQQFDSNIFVRQTCPHCRGSGEYRKTCKKCNGQGYNKERVKISISVTSGVSKLSKLRIKGKGNTVPYRDNFITGDLFVVINFPESENNISVKNGNIFVNITVPVYKMINGDKIKIDLGYKQIELQLDPHKESGYEYNIEDEGARKGRSLFVKVFPSFPKNELEEVKRKKIAKLLRESYGEKDSIVKPSSY